MFSCSRNEQFTFSVYKIIFNFILLRLPLWIGYCHICMVLRLQSLYRVSWITLTVPLQSCLNYAYSPFTELHELCLQSIYRVAWIMLTVPLQSCMNYAYSPFTELHADSQQESFVVFCSFTVLFSLLHNLIFTFEENQQYQRSVKNWQSKYINNKYCSVFC